MLDILLIEILIALIAYPIYYNVRILYFSYSKLLKTQREYTKGALGRIATFDKLMVDKMQTMKTTQVNNKDDTNDGYA